MKPTKYNHFVIRRFIYPKPRKIIYISIPEDIICVFAPTLKQTKEIIDELNKGK